MRIETPIAQGAPKSFLSVFALMDAPHFAESPDAIVFGSFSLHAHALDAQVWIVRIEPQTLVKINHGKAVYVTEPSGTLLVLDGRVLDCSVAVGEWTVSLSRRSIVFERTGSARAVA